MIRQLTQELSNRQLCPKRLPSPAPVYNCYTFLTFQQTGVLCFSKRYWLTLSNQIYRCNISKRSQSHIYVGTHHRIRIPEM